jgi:EpsI family protein
VSAVPSEMHDRPAVGHRARRVPPSVLLIAGALLVVAAGFAMGLAELWPLLHRQWTEVADYNHGYLMLAMAAWLTWRSWQADPPRRLAPDWWWLAPLAAALGTLLLMELVFLNVPRLYVLPLLLVSCIGLVFGRAAALHVIWPALLLYFALPVWVALGPHLQALTTTVNISLLDLASVPAYIEGNFVYLPAGTFVIAEGCSGLNFLIVGMSLAALYGLAFLHTWRSRALLFAIAVGVTLLSNWLRVFIIITAGHLSDMQHWLVSEHVRFGWFLFAFMLLPVLLCASWLERRGGAPNPQVGQRRSALPPAQPAMFAAAVLCAILLFLPGLPASVGTHALPTVEALPAEAAGGVPRRDPVLRWQPVFEGGETDQAAYAIDGLHIEVYRAVYPRQDRESRVIRFRHTVTGPGWRPVSEQLRTIELHEGAFRVIEHHGYAGGREALIWAWYEAGGRPATSNLGLKWQELVALTHGRRDAAAVAIASPCRPDCVTAAAGMQAFLAANASVFDGLPKRSGGQ